MRRSSTATVAALAVAAIAGLVPATAAARTTQRSVPPPESTAATRAVPTCTPGTPVVVGSSATSLTVTTPACASETGLTGYRLFTLVGSAEAAGPTVDVPLGQTLATVSGLQAGDLHRFRLGARNAEGVGPLGARSTDAAAPFTSTTALVDRQYLDFNGAAATATQRSTMVGQIADGTKTPVSAIDAAEQFAYWQQQSPVIRLYQAYFLRLPDQSGITYWVGKYRGGKKLSDISQEFSRSSEFVRRYGQLSNRAFVEQIYLNVQGRAGEKAGVDYWTGQLDSKKRNRGQVMVGFSESSEYKRKTTGLVAVVNLFTGMLRRLPTSAEVTTWSPKTRAEIIRFLLASATYVNRVGVVAPPIITTGSIPAGAVGVDHPGVTFAATGGTSPYTWELASGALPPGMSLFDDQLAGQPTGGGTFTFTVRVTDQASRTSTRRYTLTIPALAVTTASVPAGVINNAYAATQLAVANAYGTVAWSLQSGSLPPGIALSADGLISGTPTAGGSFPATVKATDDGGNTATKAFTFTISSFAITTPSTPGGTVGIPYAFNLAASGGTGYSWSITAGSLPAGLTLAASTGAITGSPTTPGTSTFTAKVDASGGKTASKAFSITVTAPNDWPQGERDGSGRAWNPGEDVITPTNVADVGEEWAIDAGLSPTIVGTNVYAAGEVPGHPATYAAMALDVTTGDVAWYGPMLPAGCTGGGPVVVTSTAVIVQCNSLLAYSRTGAHALLWDTADTDPGISTQTPLVVGTTLVAWGSDRVLGYRLSDGQRLWQQLLPSGAGSITDVAASGSSVVVAYDDRLRALNLTTGAQLWSKAGVVAGEVAIADGFVYTRKDGGVARFALADGAPGWAVLAGTGIYQLLGVDADTVYAFEATFSDGGQTSAVLRALKTSDGSQRWEAQLSTRIRAAGITKGLVWIGESQIYAWGWYSTLHAFDRVSGTELKKVDFDDNMYGTAAFGNGHVVFNQGGSFGSTTPHMLRSYGFAPPRPDIDAGMLPTGRTSTPYTATLEASGGSGGFVWSLASGSLPTGLALSSGGTISGTPTSATAVRFQAKVTDVKGRSRTRTFYLQVLGASSESWPTKGQDNSRDGWNPSETVIGRDSAAQLAFRWKTAVPAGDPVGTNSASQPVVVGNRLYDLDKLGRVSAWDTAGNTTNRAPLWTHPPTGAGNYYMDAPIESGGVLYLKDATGYIEAISATSGGQIWRKPIAPAGRYSADLLVVGTKLLMLDDAFDMRAYNTADGTAAWGGAVVALDGNELDGTPLFASDGTRAFVVAKCEVKAVTIATGAVAWTVPVKAGGSTNCGTPANAWPMVADGAVFATTYDGSIAIEAATGVVRWRSGTHGGYADGSGVIANGVWVLSAGYNEDGDLVALDLATGEQRWRNQTAAGGMRLSTAGDMVVGRSPYQLLGYDLLTGEQIWDAGAPDVVSWFASGATIAGGRLYITTSEGTKAYGLP